jgi:hypothetical protein
VPGLWYMLGGCLFSPFTLSPPFPLPSHFIIFCFSECTFPPLPECTRTFPPCSSLFSSDSGKFIYQLNVRQPRALPLSLQARRAPYVVSPPSSSR